MEEIPVKERGYKYFVKCPECGHVWKYKSMTKTVKHPEWYRCCKCQKPLERTIAA